MQTPRSHERIAVEIPIVVTTVLDSLEGMIVDLSEGGAQVVGCSLPARTQCQLDLDGHIVFGAVRWAEEDRMGIRFPYELRDGPLYEQLLTIRRTRRGPVVHLARANPRAAAPAPIGRFGRRIA